MKKKDHQVEMRYEKKWIYNKNNYYQILSSLMRSNFNFKHHYKNRIVNTVYFDDYNLSNVIDNIEGQKNRVKYRLRWYGSDKYIHKPVFETKYKKALQTYKKKIFINLKNKLHTGNLDNFNDLKKKLNLKILNNNLLQPKILISYNRTYLISSDNLIRATIDQDIKYKKLGKFDNNFFYKFNNIVMEMKYDINLDSYFRSLINNISVRYSKSSKYVNCMLLSSKEFSN
jgi:SPX domain protein involved in polyphosphate accumulation